LEANPPQKPAIAPYSFPKIVPVGPTEHLQGCEGNEVCSEGLRLLGQAFAVPIEVEVAVGVVLHIGENLHPTSPSCPPKSQTIARAKTFATSSKTSASSPPLPFALAKVLVILSHPTKVRNSRQNLLLGKSTDTLKRVLKTTLASANMRASVQACEGAEKWCGMRKLLRNCQEFGSVTPCSRRLFNYCWGQAPMLTSPFLCPPNQSPITIRCHFGCHQDTSPDATVNPKNSPTKVGAQFLRHRLRTKVRSMVCF